MRLLKDDVRARSSAEERLIELLRAAEPYRANPFRKRLMLLRIERATEARGSHVVFRSAVVAALLMGGTASAVAALGYRLLQPTTSPPEPSASNAPAAAATTARVRAATRATVPAPPATDEATTPRVEERAQARSAQRPRADATARRGNTAPNGEDPSQVLEAVRALRREGDAKRAQALLDDYLASHPKGALTEDALGLAIEAAAARRDPRAADYARRYLQRFPNGRFRAVAERAAGRR